MTLDLDNLERLARAATPGPWWVTGDPWFRLSNGVMAGSPDPHVGYMIADCEEWDGAREEYAESDGTTKIASGDADAAYIAAANPPTMLALITRLREAERERDEALSSIDAAFYTRVENVHLRDERDRLKAELDEAVGVIRRWVSWCDDWHAGKPHPSDDLDAARTFIAKHGGSDGNQS